MDYYSFNPNAADSLEFVSPLKRNFANVNNRVFDPEYSKEHAELVKSSSRHRLYRTNIPSSTSLILQKTTEREINVHEYSEFSYNNLQYNSFINPRPINCSKQRPLIKVTVIPNNTSIQKLRKRRSCTKKVQTTVSNQENSIKAKNVYLVVAGKKREKIYEVKTTGSAEFSNNHLHYIKNEEHTVEENITKFLNSLNMDKRKKGKKKTAELDNDEEYGSLNVNVLDSSKGMRDPRSCECPEDLKPTRSRIRISGKIGRTDDDRLVLNCAAMVDGKPIETNFMQGSEYVQFQAPRYCHQSPSVPWADEESRELMKRPEYQQKEAKVQADLPEESYIISPTTYPVFLSTRITHHSVETQCSPANFNTVCFSNIEKLRVVSNKDQIVQCTCPQHCPSPVVPGDVLDLDTYSRAPKSCSSPLVIISVYPKQEKVDKSTGELTGSKDRRVPKQSKEPREAKEAKETKELKKNKDLKDRKNNKDRSPKRNDKKVAGKHPTKVISPVSSEEKPRAQSSGRSKSPKRLSFDNQETGNNKKTKSRVQDKNITTSKKMFREEKTTHEVKTKIKVGVPPLKSAASTEQNGKTERPSPQIEKSTNTEPDRRCPCILHPPDQKLPTHLKTDTVMNWVSAKNNTSNVDINFDGRKGIYDVSFRQGNTTADLRVRKTFKEQGSQKHVIDDDSLENFLLTCDGLDARKRSFSQTFLLDDPPKIGIDLARNKENPGIRARDSIDLHREVEGRSSVNSTTHLSSNTSNVSNDKPFFAPVKHYQGDSCNVCNPMERDRQIQELLGVDTRLAPSRFIERTTQKTEVDLSPNIFYRTKWNTDIQTERGSTLCNIYNLDKIECACYNDKEIEVRKEEQSSTDSKSSELESPKEKKKVRELKEPREHRHHIRESRDHLKKPREHRECRNHLRESRDHLREPIAQKPRCKRVQCSNFPIPTPEPPSPPCPPCSRECCYQDNTPLYQQLILNRNINIYLQIDQFTKQKPIILSRKQYDKVKRTIESATNKKSNCICKNSCLSIGETRRRCNVPCKYAKDEYPKDEYPKDEDECPKELRNKTNQVCPKCCSKGVQNPCYESRLLGGIRKSVQFEYTQDRDGEPRFLRQSSCIQNNVNDRSGNSIAQEKHDVNIAEENGKYDNYNDEQRPFSVGATHKIQSAAEIRKGQGDIKSQTDKNKVNKQQFVREKHRPPKPSKIEYPSKSRIGVLLGKLRSPENEGPCNKVDFTQEDDDDCMKCGTLIRLHSCKICGRKTQECFKNECYFCELNKKRSRERTTQNLFDKGAARFVASSTEVRYTSVTYLKHVTFSSTNVNTTKERKPSVVNLLEKNYESDSLHTLFKGRKRTPTPNLGTSVYSIYSEYSDRTSKSKLDIQEPRPRKPFLRRLMSCLVMRSKTSQVKVGKRPHKVPSVNSSVDSYHISTSLGAIELSSSIYDTSASFYSSHSIQPISSKLKRSFLSSVRGFLNYRRN